MRRGSKSEDQEIIKGPSLSRIMTWEMKTGCSYLVKEQGTDTQSSLLVLLEGREQIATYGLAATDAEGPGNATAPGAGNATAGNPTPVNARGPLQPKKLNSNCENTPLLCFLQGFKISICYGCKNKFTTQQKKTPDDLIVKLQVKRDRLINDKWVSGWKNSWAYFQLNINCLKLVNGMVEVEDIYIPNDIRAALTSAHINKLQRMGWWTKMQMRY